MARTLSPSLTISFSRTPLTSHSKYHRLFSSSSSSPDPLLGKLEDVIHHIIVRRSEPDWLPFRPGTSYWVPPRSKSRGIAQLIGKLATQHHHPHPLSRDEFPSTTSPRGWPSSSFFLQDLPPPVHPRMEVEEPPSDSLSQSEDEEG